MKRTRSTRSRPARPGVTLMAASTLGLTLGLTLGPGALPAIAQTDNSGVNPRESRRASAPGKVRLAFKEEPLDEDLFAFIAESTGKVVMPVNLIALKTKKITVMNDKLIDRAEALDLLFHAFRLNNVGVIETHDVVIIGEINEIIQIRQMPILSATDDIMDRIDKGSLVVKIFQLKEVPAEDVGEKIGDDLPTYARITVDANSNQIVVMGDIALCQHLQQLINELDHRYVEPVTATFRLAYADATEISENVLDLFEQTASTRTGQGRTPANRSTPGRRTATNRPTASSGTPLGPEIELRVTVNLQQNSLTVFGDPTVVEKIAKLIDEEWDLPRSPGTSKIYTLRYTDPLKVAEKLNSLLNGGSGGGARPGGRARAGGGGGGVEQILSGIYSIEAYPDTSQLFVFCKTEQSFNFLDQFISELDQPSTIGIPFVTELKHANAVELAEELNALLSEPGAGATIERPGEGISGRSDDEGGGTPAGDAGTMNFPWQRGARQRDDQSPESALIGKVRIVPIVRQNALAILCPPSQSEAVQELIEYFDRPGRQVMISAVIAEVELTDDLNLGLRFSNSDDILSGANPDFRIGSTSDISGQRNDVFSNFFDTSVLDAAIPVNVVIQALQQNTNVKIVQEPIIFTADNQEALFFDGQDIPFISETVINSQGNPTDSFEYREVGVTLNVRPRITVQRDVDLEILLELSSVVPGVTLFGGAIIDRRETRTHVVVSNGQTIVISGILRDQESKITRKIPFLGDIPIIGEFFKSRENSTTTTELIAFITPHVVDNPSENDRNFQTRYRERLKELTRPVDEQAQDRMDNPERYRQMLLPVEDQATQPGFDGTYDWGAPTDPTQFTAPPDDATGATNSASQPD